MLDSTSVAEGCTLSAFSAVPAADRIIVALDCSADRARELAASLEGKAKWLKVGMTLYYAEGPSIVREFQGMGFSVFVDLKLHDIPHQVRGAAESLTAIGADMLTTHASGGPEMLRAAVEGAVAGSTAETVANSPVSEGPIVLAITVLTSMDAETLATIGVTRGMTEQVEALAGSASAAGCSGVVCSPQEATLLRGVLGPDAFIVTPGVRPAGSDVGDQSRIATPAKAIAAGASHLVIGRPITAAPDPAAAFEAIVREIREGVK